MKEIINIDLMVEKVKHKIKTECPFIFEKCSDEKQNEIIETFYRIVLDEIEINKIRHELDINTLNTVINIIKTLLPSQETFDSNASNRVYEKIPEPTTNFLKEKIITKIKNIEIKE